MPAAARDARDVFERYLPERLSGDTELAGGIRAIYRFTIPGEGVWTVDFTGDEGEVREGDTGPADCFIRLDADQIVPVFENPMRGLKLLMTGQLEIGGEYSLAEHLIKVFRPSD
jgi:hypothetical protein